MLLPARPGFAAFAENPMLASQMLGVQAELRGFTPLAGSNA
jgi:hypothetical protein